MEMKEIESAIEAILFASGEPVHVDRICMALELDRPRAEQVLEGLMDHYAYERRGVRLLRMEESWQLCSAPEHGEAVRKAFEIRKPAKLSQPALEVLTVIAYYQPTTRAYVSQNPGSGQLLYHRAVTGAQAHRGMWAAASSRTAPPVPARRSSSCGPSISPVWNISQRYRIWERDRYVWTGWPHWGKRLSPRWTRKAAVIWCDRRRERERRERRCGSRAVSYSFWRRCFWRFAGPVSGFWLLFRAEQ